MKYKPLHQKLRASRKHAAASTLANTVWFNLLPQADSAGRFVNDPVLIKSTAFPLRRESYKQVRLAVEELARLGLFHLYEDGGKQYLVFHDHSDWVAAVNNEKPVHPAPPGDLCRCCGEVVEKKPKETGPSGPFSSPSPLPLKEGGPGEGEPVRLAAARAYKAANGWKKSIEALAEDFVSLENAGAPLAFVSEEIPKQLGEAPWVCCDRVRKAWLLERERRADAEAALRRRRADAAPTPSDEPPTPEQRARFIAQAAGAVRRGHVKLGDIDPEIREDVERELRKERA